MNCERIELLLLSLNGFIKLSIQLKMSETLMIVSIVTKISNLPENMNLKYIESLESTVILGFR